MNGEHLKAFVWLRWRLTMNQWNRAGSFNAALMIILAIGLVTSAVPLAIGSFVLATYAVPKASPAQLMYAWDGLIGVFLMFWTIGLLAELQRNDPLSLSKFMHLPVSIRGAFLINYVSSMARLSLFTFGPPMLAYALGLVYVQGVSQLLVIPALAAFFLMITAPTYQFQGWLASLMGNPRRRRAVVMGTTMAFVLVFQLPNLLNMYAPKGTERRAARSAARDGELALVDQSLRSGEIDAPEMTRRKGVILERFAAELNKELLETSTNLRRTARIANTVLPIGWLPLGVMESAEGRVLPSLLGTAGMTLIGLASLRLAYRSTVAQFLGRASSRPGRVVVAPASSVASSKSRALEARIFGLSEPVSAVALGGFQSLLRSPEAKMSLLMPLIMGAVFGSMWFRSGQELPEWLRPIGGFGAIGMVLFGMLQLMSNVFGMDRDGFRVFVLCAAPRRDILLGKNLAFAPPAFALSMILLAVVQFFRPMRVDQALAMLPQSLSMYMVFCMTGNLTSVYAPYYLNPGTLKAANPKLTTILLQLALFLLVFPIGQASTLIPFGVEALLRYKGMAEAWPVALILAILECPAIALIYLGSLRWLGGRLQAREREILEVVTNRGGSASNAPTKPRGATP